MKSCKSEVSLGSRSKCDVWSVNDCIANFPNRLKVGRGTLSYGFCTLNALNKNAGQLEFGSKRDNPVELDIDSP